MSLPADVKRPLLIKCEEETDPRYGKPPHERSVEELLRFGVINLDKPRGPTSHQVAAWVKQILKLNKVGHGGTLDPKVSGILPITLENATKVVRALLRAGKEYVCVMRLHGDVRREELEKILKQFVGEIYQKPPLRSSVKKTVRIKHIYYIDLLEVKGRFVLFKVGCEAGTYIRKLCHDIGEVLGVGAHMYELRRTRVGPFKEDSTLARLQDILDAYIFWKEDGNEKLIRRYIQPMEKAVEHLPKIYIKDNAVDAICNGAMLAAPGVVKLEDGIKPGDLVAIMTLKGELVALAEAKMSSREILEAEKGIVAVTTRVIMPRGTYPPAWRKRKEGKEYKFK